MKLILLGAPGAGKGTQAEILSNILNIDITLLQTEQGPGYGAAMLAMVGCGAYADVEVCANQFVKLKKTVTPDPVIAARYETKYQKFKEIYPALKNLFKELK